MAASIQAAEPTRDHDHRAPPFGTLDLDLDVQLSLVSPVEDHRAVFVLAHRWHVDGIGSSEFELGVDD
jgi:hypothetical protein